MTSDTPDPLDVHVVSHTHWDREWYHPAARFRQRLVALVRELLNAPDDPTRSFLLDGQTVILEDVLAVHPEWEPQLRARLSSGALEAGPWYVLADELIPSGEALVRNLLVGRRTLARLGAVPPRVCYSPDAFGHPAALPTIAAGFGLRVAVLWRGYGSARWPQGDAARWVAPDGSELMLWHLPRDGYEYGSDLPVAEKQAEQRWARIARDAVARASTNVVLLTNGADHHARQPALDDAVNALARAAYQHARATVHRSSLSHWAAAFEQAAINASLPQVHGELRDSYGFTWTLQGTLGTRAWQKRAVARADAQLRWDVEPWMAMASLKHGATADAGLLDVAWRTFLRTLPHDTLCGCSVDDVAYAMDARLASVRTQADGLRAASLNALLERDAASARAVARTAWSSVLVIRNRSTTPRWGLVEAELLTTVGDVSVGPDSASVSQPQTPRVPVLRSTPAGLCVQPQRARLIHARRESPHHYPDDDLVHALRCLVWIPRAHAVPATGLSCWPMSDAPTSPEAAPECSVRLTRDAAVLTMENDRLRVSVGGGRVSLHDKRAARTVDDLLHVTWQSDAGDAYTPSPRGTELRLTAVRTRVRARGPLRSEIDVTARVLVSHAPAAPDLAFSDARDLRHDAPDARSQVRSVPRRSARLRPIRVRLRLSLDAGASHLRVQVLAIDRAPDHRLRLVIATGLPNAEVLADAAFGPVVRARLKVSDAEQLAEHVVHSAPLHRWVARHTAQASTVVVSDGLAEYEAMRDGTVAITLVRATGELSRANLVERPGHAGWPAPVPGAQGPGRVRARFGICLDGAIDVARIEAVADDVLRPLVAETWRDAPRAIGAEVTAMHGVELRGVGVVASALKPADDGDGIILRAINLRDEPGRATWVLPYGDLVAEAVRLDESALDPAEPIVASGSGNTSELHVTMLPRAVSSVRVRRRLPDHRA